MLDSTIFIAGDEEWFCSFTSYKVAVDEEFRVLCRVGRDAQDVEAILCEVCRTEDEPVGEGGALYVLGARCIDNQLGASRADE